MSIFKIHFFRCIDIQNAGDMACGPYLYFDAFHNYPCVYHELGHVDYDIAEDDVVILGASGLFGVSQQYANNINILLNKCRNVIAWSVGHNDHNDHLDKVTNIQYEKFSILTVRDWNYKEERYVPCVTCMLPGLSERHQIKRRIGVVEHVNYPIREFEYERISNIFAVEFILKFIGESEVIITNSWHCVYWATLMKKKVVLYNSFSNKFNYFKFPPVCYSGDIEKDIECAITYPTALDECRDMNRSFCDEVISYIDSVRPCVDKDLNYEYIIRKEIDETISKIIKDKRVAICGAGEHTAQFIKYFGAKINIVLITGQELLAEYKFDYPFYKESELEKCSFDCVLLSSFRFRCQMKEELKNNNVKVEIIDIYENIEKKGIRLSKDFYKYFSRLWIKEDR